MTLAEKFDATDSVYAGKVAYIYCLTCDGALSQRIEYTQTTPPSITSWRRYEYDGLNLLRVDERYDSAGGAIDDTDNWRKKELATHKPGSLGNLLGKKVYNYISTNYTDTPNTSAFYTYHYDAVGNVLWVTDSGGVLSHSFTQDAFGNALTTGSFSGSSWSTARTSGITEHQTGKWIDLFTGLYFFSARWYDPLVGRFVGRDKNGSCNHRDHLYALANSNPIRYIDPDGNQKIPYGHVDVDKSCGCSLGEIIAMDRAIDEACAHLASLEYRVNPSMWECMMKSCQKRKIICSHDCEEGTCGQTIMPVPRPTAVPTFVENIEEMKVCPNSQGSNLGVSAIHEMGHGCNCSEVDFIYEGRPCGWLPWRCGEVRRGF